MKNLYQIIFKQVDPSFLSVFRMGFGAILLFDCINYGIFLCLQCDYHDTDLLFKYAGFEWIHPLSTIGLKALWLIMGIFAAGVMLGWYYRFSMIAFTIGFTYQFLLDEALYLNHFYMVILFCVLMCFIPANRHWAMDAKRHPATACTTISNWPRFLLGAQLEIILIYAGLVKINYDWLNLEPLRLWLTASSADEGPLLQLLTMDWGIAIAAYGSILLHLVGAPLLLFKRTRLYVLAAYACFHITNAFVFNIGIFPWFTLFGSLVLFDADWPRQFWNWLRSRISWLQQRYRKLSFPDIPQTPVLSTSANHLIVAGITAWLLVQLLAPWRHLVLPGDVAWNEVGHRYSWRMKLRSKRGVARFIVTGSDAGGEQRWSIDPANHLNLRQTRKMPCIPDMVWQFGQFLEQEYKNKGFDNVAVYADIRCSLNGRRYARFIDPTVDLTKISRYTHPDEWIVPLNEPHRDPVISRMLARITGSNI